MNFWSSYPNEDDFLKSHFSFFVFWFPNGYGLNGRYTDFGAIGFGAVTLKIVPGAKIVPAYVIHSNPFQTCLATDDRNGGSRRMTWKVLEHSQTRSLSATRQITLILQITFISVPNFIFVLYGIVFIYFPTQ